MPRRAGSQAEPTVTPMPVTSAITTVLVVTTTGPPGISKPIAPKRPLMPAATPRPAKRPATDAKRPTTAASASTDRSTCLRLAPIALQQRHLTRALGDDDREGVRDDERTDEDRDVGEHHQERGDEAHLLAGVGLLLLGDRVAGEHLGARGQRRRDAVGELGLCRAVGREDADRVDLTRLGEQTLRGVRGEQARLGAAHAVGRAELRDARDREHLGIALRQDRDLVADVEVDRRQQCACRSRRQSARWVRVPSTT